MADTSAYESFTGKKVRDWLSIIGLPSSKITQLNPLIF